LKNNSSRSTGDFDPLLHVLSPKYEILSDDQKAEVLQRYRVKPHNLPKMLVTDPAAKVLGAKLGDIIKMTRNSETAGKVVSYRLVVSE